MTTALIVSAKYITPEMQSEMGRIPPVFLPIANSWLLTLQLRGLKEIADRIVLTLPSDYELTDTQSTFVRENGVEIHQIPRGQTLGEAVVYALNVSGIHSEPVLLLHGDTYCGDLESVSVDTVGVALPQIDASWGTLSEEGDKVLCGVFHFKSPSGLIASITRARGDFVEGLKLYSAEVSRLEELDIPYWLDFGHLNAFYDSRRRITTGRVFNTLEIGPLITTKRSEKIAKMEAEANWFENLPPILRLYTPTYLGRTRDEKTGLGGYRLETLYCLPLSDLFLFAHIGAVSWKQILRSCDAFLTKCLERSPTSELPDPKEFHLGKTLERLETYSRQTGRDMAKPISVNGVSLPSPMEMAHAACDDVLAFEPCPGISHGDFCFSNILYDFKSQRIKVVDPRGHLLSDEPSVFGDLRYDLAKLCHSAFGLYDQIISEQFRISCPNSREFVLEIFPVSGSETLLPIFRDWTFAGLSPMRRDIRALTVLLFLSMLPLHADNPQRQLAFLANAGRLFGNLRERNA